MELLGRSYLISGLPDIKPFTIATGCLPASRCGKRSLPAERSKTYRADEGRDHCETRFATPILDMKPNNSRLGCCDGTHCKLRPVTSAPPSDRPLADCEGC